jgi:hypothetical protein
MHLVGFYKETLSVTLNTEEEHFIETSECSSATWQKKIQNKTIS